jgi:hypothetical protein
MDKMIVVITADYEFQVDSLGIKLRPGDRVELPGFEARCLIAAGLAREYIVPPPALEDEDTPMQRKSRAK